MPSARIEENIRKQRIRIIFIKSRPLHVLHLQTHNPRLGRKRLNRILQLCNMLTIRRFKDKTLISQVRSKGHDTTPAVAAHHSARAIRVIIPHPEIRIRTPLKHHHSIRPDTGMTLAQPRNLPCRKVNVNGPSVSNQKIIPRSVIFVESHHLNKSSSSTEASVLPSLYFTMTGV